MTRAELIELIRNDETSGVEQSGRIEYGLKPVQGAEAASLDQRRLRNYFGHVLGWGTPGIRSPRNG